MEDCTHMIVLYIKSSFIGQNIIYKTIDEKSRRNNDGLWKKNNANNTEERKKLLFFYLFKENKEKIIMNKQVNYYLWTT